MTRIDERVSTHVYKVKRISKEEMESIAGCAYTISLPSATPPARLSWT